MGREAKLGSQRVFAGADGEEKQPTRRRWKGNVGTGEWEIQTTACKVGSRMYCIAQGI